MDYASYLEWTNDFPKPGIKFCDIWSLLAKVDLRKVLSDKLKERWQSALDGSEPIFLGGIEARGFAVAGMLTQAPWCVMVPIRKVGKLPPKDIVQQGINLEYGADILEMQKAKAPGANMILVDDVLATGGTLDGAKILAEKAGYTVIGAVVLVNLLAVKKTSDWPASDNVVSLIDIGD